MGTDPDHYAALGINRDATPEEIRRAYHRKARKLHPDVNEETGATELFLNIQYAYEVLSDPAQRIEYDQNLPPLPRTAPLVEFSTIYSRPTLLRLGEPQLIYVLLDLAAPANTQTGPSLPLNLCLVIDRSTSMHGERMDMVKATAIELVRQVRPEDTLSIVTFSDRAEVLVSAGRNLARSTIEEKIRQILTSGGTEIYRGLEAGYLEVRSKANRTSVNHIILITDGRTYGDEAQCLEIAEQSTTAGIGISSLGIGAEWNDAFLDGLTSRTGGSTVYVSHAQDIQQFLWQKFSGLGQVYADRVNLELFFNPGVELSYAFRLSPDVATLQTSSPLPLGSILLQSHLPFTRTPCPAVGSSTSLIWQKEKSPWISRGRLGPGKAYRFSSHVRSASLL
jgi:Ca-activated chloride channel family protein